MKAKVLCEICGEEKDCLHLHEKNKLRRVCKDCRILEIDKKAAKRALRNDKDIRTIIIDSIKKKYNRKQILFITELTNEELDEEISKLKNLKPYRNLRL